MSDLPDDVTVNVAITILPARDADPLAIRDAVLNWLADCRGRPLPTAPTSIVKSVRVKETRESFTARLVELAADCDWQIVFFAPPDRRRQAS